MVNTRSVRQEPAGRAVGASGRTVVTGCRTWSEIRARAGAFLSEHAADPFVLPVLVTPGPAHRRSIAQGFAASPGGPQVFAGVRTPTMGGLRTELEHALLGLDPDEDPWRTGALTLRIASLLRECADEPWLALVRRHLDGHPAPEEPPRPAPGRLVATAEGWAGILRGYLRHCPGMLAAWSQGSPVDPLGAPLADRDRWQALLWQRLTTALAGWPHPGLRHEQLLEGVRGADPAALPVALGAACVEAPPAADIELLAALAERLPVEIWQLGPPEEAGAVGCPLRERYGAARAESWRRWEQAPVDVADGAGPRADGPTVGVGTMLGLLQRRIREGRTADAPVPADGTVTIHASHGPDRQVEVLREALCDAFASDPTLQPREVAVLCTDIAAYAPLLEADLGATDAPGHHPGHDLRAGIAGPSLARPNQVIDVLLVLLALPASRATGADLIALASREPVARALGLDAEGLERLGRLVERAQIRWGIDAGHRAEHGLPGIRQSTWIAGVDRLLAGLALADSPLARLGTVVPLDHVDGSDAGLVGALAELVSRVRMHLLRFAEPAGIAAWRARLLDAAADLTAPGPDDQWMLNHLSSALTGLDGAGADGALLDAGDIAAVLRRLVAPRRGRPNYGAGSMIICGLGEMQAIEHRVVAVLGVDDAHVPPRTAAAGDDLLARPGVRDELPVPNAARAARQQLLDAIMSAGERLIIVGAGADPRTGEALPQPVVMADIIEACTGLEPGAVWERAHEGAANGGAPTVLRVHPLQPHAASNFDPDAPGGLLSFDPMALAGARAGAAPPGPAHRRSIWSVQGPAPGKEARVMSIDEFVAFFRDPIRAWAGRTFGFLPDDGDDEPPTGLPIVLDGLENWAVDEAITAALIAGQPVTTVSDAALLGGRLPPGRLGTDLLGARLPALEAHATAVRALLVEPAEHDVLWHDGPWSVSGTLESHAGRLVRHRCARLRARHLGAAWVELVCAAAGGADVREALLLGKGDCFRLVAPDAATARTLLGQMCRLRLDGLSRFPPMPPDTCLEYARRTAGGRRGAGAFLARDYSREVAFSPVLQWVGASWRDIEAIGSEPEDPLTASSSRILNLARWFYGPLVEALHLWTPGARHDH